MTATHIEIALFFVIAVVALAALSWFVVDLTDRKGLLRKELRHYFASPIAWLVMAGFAFVNGYIFLFIVDYYSQVSAPNSPLLQTLFGNGFFWILQFILVPSITMRLFAEERASGTLEALMTAPVTDVEVVLAKFLAAWIFYAALWAPTLVHVAAAYYYGVPDGFMAGVQEGASRLSSAHLWALGPIATLASFVRELNATIDFGPIFASYLGVFLMGGAWLALGVLASALTRNQVVAFMLGFVATIMSFAIGFSEQLLGGAPSWIRSTIHYLSFQSAFETFPRGIVDTRPVIYFLSLTALGLFLSVRAVESRKWR